MRILIGVLLLLGSTLVHAQQEAPFSHDSFLDLGIRELGGIKYRYFGCNTPGTIVARIKRDFPAGTEIQVDGQTMNHLRLLQLGHHTVQVTDASGQVTEFLYVISGIDGLLALMENNPEVDKSAIQKALNLDAQSGTCLLSQDKIMKAMNNSR